MMRPEAGQGARKLKSYMLAGGLTETKAGDLGPPHQQLHADPGAEGETRDPAMLGVGVHRLQVVERRGRIAEALPMPWSYSPWLRPTPRKLKRRTVKPILVKRVMQVVDDAVVHRAAELRMRVQDDGDRRVLGLFAGGSGLRAGPRGRGKSPRAIHLSFRVARVRALDGLRAAP